jgi:hypothetical protein
MPNYVKTVAKNPFKGTSDNALGQSVEAQAQLRDAAKESSTFVGRDETLGVYELVPIPIGTLLPRAGECWSRHGQQGMRAWWLPPLKVIS